MFTRAGFFEWHKVSKGKSIEKWPYFVHPLYSSPVQADKSSLNKTLDDLDRNVFDDRPLMYLAALYDSWIDKDTNDHLYSVTIMTTTPAKDLEWLHNRQPVILTNEEDRRKWLDCEHFSFKDVKYMLKCSQKGELEWYPVDRCVGNVRNKQLQCVVPLQEKSERSMSISSFFKPLKTETEMEAAKKSAKHESKTEQQHVKKAGQSPSSSVNCDSNSHLSLTVKSEKDANSRKRSANFSEKPLSSPKRKSKAVK